MNISVQWIRDLVPGLDVSASEMGERLAERGAPIEGMTSLAEGLDAVVVGRVIETGPHPNADRLSLCTVDSGNGSVQVVCGAPNVVQGRCYPFAPVGSTLPGGLTLSRRKIRGVYSEGMLCSPAELGLGTDQSGLMELPGDPAPGVSLPSVLGLNDVELDVEVTPNRGDLLSHVGVAREVIRGDEGPIRLPEIPGSTRPSYAYAEGGEEASHGGVRIRIEDPELCPRYLGAVIRGVGVGPSPPWLKARLRAVGARPINNVVDATNYVLLELGQPLHAFDLDRIGDRTVVVRRARTGETLKTLDGEQRSLDQQMLLICDADQPIAIGGVMGGLDSEVTDTTTQLLLECALFDPASIRRTRMELGMSTDASYRYERGVDPDGMRTALERAVELILSVAGGELGEFILDACPRPWEAQEVPLRPARVRHVLGVPFTTDRIVELLAPLGFSVETHTDDEALLVTVPGYRSYDVRREVDLIEEIARTHGYENFPADLSPFRPSAVPDDPLFELERRLRDDLVGDGFYEVHTMAFSSAGDVAIPNPVSAEEAHLRSELLPGVLDRIAYNLARGVRDLRFFEIGTVFRTGPVGHRPAEFTHLALAMTGRRDPGHWSIPDTAIDIWDLKYAFERVVLATHPTAEVTDGSAGPLSSRLDGPCWVAKTDAAVVGVAGRVSDGAIDSPRWAGPVFGVELVLPEIPPPPHVPTIARLPQYPAIERDLALIAPEGVSAGSIVSLIGERGGRLLRSVRIFDVYEGEGIAPGARSIAVRLRFQDPDRTLRDQDVEPAVARIIKRLRGDLNVEHRA
jgi:phenylalanyl-tRNA synthetase beta chain